jgi:hypothetical protein
MFNYCSRNNYVFNQIFLGLDLQVLEALFDLVNVKANNLYMWKGLKYTRLKGVLSAHLQVQYLLIWVEGVDHGCATFPFQSSCYCPYSVY